MPLSRLHQPSSRGMKIDSIGGFDARGFILGPPVALALNIPFFMLRKKVYPFPCPKNQKAPCRFCFFFLVNGKKWMGDKAFACQRRGTDRPVGANSRGCRKTDVPESNSRRHSKNIEVFGLSMIVYM